MSKYELYAIDVETTNLDPNIGDIIELSIIRMSTDEQRTYFIRPLNIAGIDVGALKVNGHKMEDLKMETKFGRETYQEPSKVIIEVENWLSEDDKPASGRICVGQNVQFDHSFMKSMWKKLNASDSFPFGRRLLDTMQNAFILDLIEGKEEESYSLGNLIKKYGIKNIKAHSASADTRATKQLFEAQIKDLKNRMGK